MLRSVIHDSRLNVLDAVRFYRNAFSVVPKSKVKEARTYCDFPYGHRTRDRTNSVTERLNREIRRRTRTVGYFPDGESALMPIRGRLCHAAGTQWGNK